MWLAFPGPAGGFYPLVFVGLALLFGLTRARGARQAGLTALAWGSAFFIPHISWAREAVGTAGPWLALAGVQIAIVTVWAIALGWVWSARALRRHAWLWWLLVSLTYPGVEQLRAHVPYGGFGWGIVAYPLVDSPLKSLAPWIGEVGLSIVAAAISAGLVLAIAPLSRIRHRIGGLAIIIALVAAASVLPLNDAGGAPVRVAAVQGNVDRPVKQTYGSGQVLRNHVDETVRSLDGASVDIVLWGEHAADRDPDTDAFARAQLERAEAVLDAPLLYGAVRTEGTRRWGEYRWAGHPEATYAKRHPVPFGEYIPDRGFYARLSSEVDQITTDMVAGQSGGVMPVATRHGTVNLGIALCFEAAFDRHVRDDVQHGAEIIVVPTNNALFGTSAESVQQLQMTRLRALEYARPAIQVSTQGVSAIVRPDGSLSARSQLFTARTLIADVTPATMMTPAARIGSGLEYATMALALAWVGLTLLSSPVIAYRRHKRGD
nr:apolipoprotein N-acyltransferase [Nanchangia anserum]